MSVPDSRKSFLAKLALCGLAVAALPRLLWPRLEQLGQSGLAEGRARRTAGGLVTVRNDPRAVARDSVEI